MLKYYIIMRPKEVKYGPGVADEWASSSYLLPWLLYLPLSISSWEIMP
jgi:hypothetical protein